MYIPLYVKTNYSLLSSLITIDTLIETCQKNQIPAVAICDFNLYGAMEFYQKCKKAGIRPILGLELLLQEQKILLYAKNYEGYQTLIKLATIQSERMITLEDLQTYHKSVIAIVPWPYRTIFSSVNSIFMDLYLGFENLAQEQEAKTITNKIVFLKEMKYFYPKEKEYLPYLYRIRDGKTVADEDYEEEEACFVEDPSSYSGIDGRKATEEIANLCQLEFPKPELMLPIYPCENGLSPTEYLTELSKAGLMRRLKGQVSEAYQKRLLYELSVIDQMGFSNYFLVVYDFIKYAKKNGILVGPGRGSAAGSLVSYTLGITDIDPLQYDLLFERFLNPERVTMPDIDTDFPDQYRDQVIDYVVSKYGAKRVAGIITFGTLGAKQVIRDVSRTLNIPLVKVDALCKFIPTVTKLKLKDFYQTVEGFRAKIDSDLQLKKMFEIACLIEGFPRHTSIHAAGIVMCEKPLDEVIPLVKNENLYLTSYSMEYLEDLGLLKMDFLGLKNLTTIMNILREIESKEKIKIDFNQIPMDDKEALSIFTTANTSGIFQFESAGMRNFLRKLKPTSLEDICAAIALFRPGPAVNIDSYIRRKHGQEEVKYLDPILEPILKNTYGILIYQEQIMQVANVFAGYRFGEADILRRAMSKKKVDVLANERSKFVEQSVALGHDRSAAEELFSLILNFAGYGFNRSHSVAYSIIAYKMAYLKANYPKYFFSQLLSSVIGSETKTNEYLMEAKSNHIVILKPNINQSLSQFEVTKDGILFPLSNIKGVGNVACSEILKARGDTPFVDIYDAMSRLCFHNIGKKTIENLILADTFSIFGWNKATLIHNLDSLMNYAELTKDLDPSLVIAPEIEVVEEYSKQVLLEQEKQMFGFYISNHPTSYYLPKESNAILINQLDQFFNRSVVVLILVEALKTIDTKQQEKMAFITGSDPTGQMDFVLFPRTYQLYSNIEKGTLWKVIGTVEKRLDRIQVVVQKMSLLEKEKGSGE